MIEKIRSLKEKIKKIQLGENTGHDWWHTYRVYKNSINIAKIEKEKGENINFELVEISALLHDIADHKFGYTDYDREMKIKELLNEINVDLEIQEKVVQIVNNISFSKGNIPELLEGKIVQDGDRIDALGAIGIARTFAYGGAMGREIYSPKKDKRDDSLYHFDEKLFLIKDKLNTKGGKEIAQERDKFIRDFITQFYKEWGEE